ncbi:MAG TPA: hypothetical protein VKE51_24200 [Vicinamibacterales bacterium]|nr:hypothetical protein [Vicinamibacterales bacterium]
MTLKRDYCEGMIRLGVWYVRWLLTRRQISKRRVPDALTRRVNIYRLTSLWDGVHDPAYGSPDRKWDDLAECLASLVCQSSLEQTAELEERAVALIQPLFGVAPEPPPRPAFGCWGYEVVGQSITDGPGLFGRLTNRRKIARHLVRLAGLPMPERHITLHFFNACAPRSPFDNVGSVAIALQALIRDCRERHPTVQTLWCQSWLNRHPAFLALFPETWRNSAALRTTEDTDRRSFGRACLNTHNWWGQFMRCDGGFHEVRAQRFRSSGGVFPYANCLCHAGIDEIDAFLADLLRQQSRSMDRHSQNKV